MDKRLPPNRQCQHRRGAQTGAISRATHRSCTCVCVFVRAEGGNKGSGLVTVRSLSYGLDQPPRRLGGGTVGSQGQGLSPLSQSQVSAEPQGAFM